MLQALLCTVSVEQLVHTFACLEQECLTGVNMVSALLSCLRERDGERFDYHA